MSAGDFPKRFCPSNSVFHRLRSCLLWHNYTKGRSTLFQRSADDEWVHGKPLHLSVLEDGVLHTVSHDKCDRIEEQSEIVRSVGVARHAVSLEVLQVFYPQFHFTTSAVTFVDGLNWIVPIAGDDKTDIGPFGWHFNLCYNTCACFHVPALYSSLKYLLICRDDKNKRFFFLFLWII